jgi:hypothetical protein
MTTRPPTIADMVQVLQEEADYHHGIAQTYAEQGMAKLHAERSWRGDCLSKAAQTLRIAGTDEGGFRSFVQAILKKWHAA